MKAKKGKSLCIQCGERKPFASTKCGKCGFKPKSIEDAARSLILSEAFDSGNEVVGKTKAELDKISKQYADGRPYEFDAAEVRRVAKGFRRFQAITPRRLLVDGLRWLGPPLLIVISMVWIIFSKHSR